MVFFRGIYPVLPTFDMTRSVNLFSTVFEFSVYSIDDPEDPAYVILKKDGLSLHLQFIADLTRNCLRN